MCSFWIEYEAGVVRFCVGEPFFVYAKSHSLLTQRMLEAAEANQSENSSSAILSHDRIRVDIARTPNRL